MSYGNPTDDLMVPPSYIATFESANGTQIQVSWYDPSVMGVTEFSDDDFQSVVDVLANDPNWTFVNAKKSHGTKQVVTPT